MNIRGTGYAPIVVRKRSLPSKFQAHAEGLWVPRQRGSDIEPEPPTVEIVYATVIRKEPKTDR